ncbi:MAG: hypothetical protein KGJ23_14470 [Euryarchaeota archaeon]|nr:hypothetical protein [Euryarchaeota archaeon]MDE1837804.1 hypothetical protein [Euryarchaeota archaeon]MDE1880359.1 hypothetical protein [Euryarchaeota archaeon]MDE2046188.1 hypothetical protein [Thermoplasmata archaeon]
MTEGRARSWLGSDPNVHFAFGAVALLLVLVILLTPALLNGGLSGGSFLSQGALYVARSGTDNLSFAFESQGNVEYTAISVALNLSAGVLGPSFPGNDTTPRGWDRWFNVTDSLVSLFVVRNVSEAAHSRFVVNVTAVSSSSVSEGTFAFSVQGSATAMTLTVYPIWPLRGSGTLPEGSNPIPWTDRDLPQGLALALMPLPPTTSVLLMSRCDIGGGPAR